jgi:peptidylprolyl isomerase domain and WD repeat-containing protein 1
MASTYEKSYSHPGTVTRIIVTPTQFIITADSLGHIKFWKKSSQGIEFVKRFRPHLQAITGMACTADGTQLCTVGKDQFLRFFDVVSFDMLYSVELKFVPSTCEFVHHGSSPFVLVAVGDQNSGTIRIFKGWGGVICKEIQMHSSPVHLIRKNPEFDAIISADVDGQIEIWSLNNVDFSIGVDDDDLKQASEEDDFMPLPSECTFQFKAETDLFEFVKAQSLRKDDKLVLNSIQFSPNGEQFATISTDMHVRLFNFRSCKKVKEFNETIQFFETAQNSEDSPFKVEPIDFGRKVAVEKSLIRAYQSDLFCEQTPISNLSFDFSGNFLIYSTILGIKIVNLRTSKMKVLLGKVDNQQRFLNVHLFQGNVIKQTGSSFASQLNPERFLAQKDVHANPNLKDSLEDPTIFCSAFRKQQFFLFSRRDPDEKYGFFHSFCVEFSFLEL